MRVSTVEANNQIQKFYVVYDIFHHCMSRIQFLVLSTTSTLLYRSFDFSNFIYLSFLTGTDRCVVMDIFALLSLI